MNQATQFFTKSLDFNLGNFSFSPTYLQAGAIVFLIFLLILVFAQMRRHFINWSVKGAFFGIFFGFLLALILEGFLIIGGKTAIIEVLGWKNAPKPISNVLDLGREKLVNVLGITSQIPVSNAETLVNSDKVMNLFQSLNPSEAQKVRSMICKP